MNATLEHRTSLAGGPGVVLDVALPEGAPAHVVDWADRAEAACNSTYGPLCRWLRGETPVLPGRATIVFQETIEAVVSDRPGGPEAVTVPIFSTQGTIVVNMSYLERHPEDVGMAVHELVHVMQQYPTNDPAWLVEGIADCWRYHHHEPEHPSSRPALAGHSYREGFWVAGAMLAWVERTIDPGFIPVVDRLLRIGSYHDGIFAERTGSPLPELWEHFRSAATARA